MNERDTILRAIGILTQTTDWACQIEADPDADPDTGSGVVGELLQDVMPDGIEVSEDASPREVAAAISKEIRGPLMTLLAGMAMAFHELAVVHDAGRTDVSSTDVLRELALRMETHWPDDHSEPPS